MRLPKPIRRAGDRGGGAIVGFANFLLRLYEAERPRAVLVAWDTLDAPTYRQRLFPAYQGGRQFDAELVDQLDVLPGSSPPAASPMPRPPVTRPTTSSPPPSPQRSAAVAPPVASGDRDAFQLASAATTILHPIKGGEMARIGPAEVRERYGVEPRQVPDFIALRGDPSDKLPGARGVGPKGAATLLRQYGTLEAVLADGQSCRAGQELKLYKRIATMDAEAPLPPLRDQTSDLGPRRRARAATGSSTAWRTGWTSRLAGVATKPPPRKRAAQPMLKIATFNINNVNRRLPNLLAWLREVDSPTVVCLQELKATRRCVPRSRIRDVGYRAIWRGQRTYNGVAILSRIGEPQQTRDRAARRSADTQSRYIEAAVQGVLIASIYLPNGNPQPGPKFDYKLAWFDRLIAHAQSLYALKAPVVLAGDFNVVPTDRDIYPSTVLGEGRTPAAREPRLLPAPARSGLGRCRPHLPPQ